MANASIYSEFVKANKPFATLGEIAAQKQERETTRLNQEIAKTNLSEVQRKAAAAAKAEAQAAARQQLVQSAVQKYTRPDGSFDQRGALAEIRAADYEAGDAFEAHLAETHKKAQDARKVELDNQDKTWGLIAQSLQSVTPQTYRPIWSRINSMDPEMGAFLGPEYDPAKVQTALAAGTSRTEYNNAYKTILSEKKDAKEKTLGLLAIAKDPEHWQDALDFAELNGVADDIKAMGLEQFTPDAPERVAQFIMGPKEVAGLAEQKADNERQAAVNAETARHNRVTEGQGAARLAQARAGAAGGGTSADDELVATVVAEPGLWDQLTPTVKGRIAAKLKAKGYEGFGKPMTESAMKQVAESESAIDSLKDLKETLKKNEQYIGPLAGLQAMNPYSEARKAQANIDLVRQRVGKALEGGVLRKEDEEKYKKILATLRDTPETAVYKVDQLIKNIENNVANYKHQQRLGGKRVEASDPKKNDPMGLR